MFLVQFGPDASQVPSDTSEPPRFTVWDNIAWHNVAVHGRVHSSWRACSVQSCASKALDGWLLECMFAKWPFCRCSSPRCGHRAKDDWQLYHIIVISYYIRLYYTNVYHNIAYYNILLFITILLYYILIYYTII